MVNPFWSRKNNDRIKPLQVSIRARVRFNLWRLCHPRKYAKMKRCFARIDEMHEYTGIKVVPLSRR